ncbi:bifunctional phosphoribosyl-AMP cyclohydrolase/phosphoribosyl-ATP diphosphatase HisIE [bacterium]|nr:bifunctional phosphoribosyl-AMP cyclohydrolase/phosphoribosyl-ATP diphosphatase HisIE [bacterium]MBU1152610.1 bifunctional phosphoribosyl-AMP cyclohydrolase/phosphoribosyl-ATP diphosphatase HisIE [bacterium]
MKEKIEENIENLKYNEQGLIPAIIQDYLSKEVLMLAYMNKESLQKTVESKKTCFFSRSRGKFWTKGETSGHYQEIKDITYDCDKDTLLIKVKQDGVACHTGEYSCFYTSLEGEYTKKEPLAESIIDEVYREEKEECRGQKRDSKSLEESILEESIIDEVYRVIEERKNNFSPGSYVSSLIKKGEDEVLKKIIEEAGEVVIDGKKKDKEKIIMEVADLWFHLLVLLNINHITPSDIYLELKRRRKK